MLKKTITYTDFDGNQVTEDHYFHLSKADLVEMEVSQEGGLQDYLNRVVASQNGAQIIQEFKNLVRRAYGQRVGGNFIKNPQKTDEFMSSEAYSEFFMGLVTDADAAANFVNGVIPQGLEADVAKLEQMTNTVKEEDPTDLTDPVTSQILTQAEIEEMDSDELKSGLATGRYKLS